MHSLGKIQQSFQRALQSYNDNANIQQTIAKRLVDLAFQAGLPTQVNRALEIGCGTGFLTQQLSQSVGVQEMFVNDLVPSCEDFINQLIPDSTQWQFLSGDIETAQIPNQLDLISSASTLQWVNDLQSLLGQLTQKLNSHGYLVISSFAEEHFTEIRSVQSQLQKDASGTIEKNIDYPMNYWSSAQWNAALSEEYDVLSIHSDIQTAQFDSVKELLMHLRLTGVNGNARQRWTQQKLNRFSATYAENFQENGKFKLSYNPIYVVAKKRVAEKIATKKSPVRKQGDAS